MRFRDREDAGRRLAQRLTAWRGEHPVVIALPRGGVPVAAAIAEALGSPLDVLVVRKLGHPLQPELGVGAIGEGGVTVLNQDMIDQLQVDLRALRAVRAREEAELLRRVDLYRGGRPRVPLEGRTVVLVDDGLATGFTARAAIEILRRAGVGRIVVAVPVAPTDTLEDLRDLADDVVCLEAPYPFRAIGEWYEDFSQVDDAEVIRLLTRAHAPAADPGGETTVAEVDVASGSLHLAGTLVVPAGARGLVLFAHGSGSSRHSPRNRYVADTLNRAGLATLLFDLLSDAEAADRGNVFDVELLADRLLGATAWCRERGLPAHIGYFGASTGAAAALLAAAALGPGIQAVVSRGGRPDLAGVRLSAVTAPTLLIVGGDDEVVLALNQQAAAHLTRCEHRLTVVPGATHLFEEPGTLEAAARLAGEWFTAHLGSARPDAPLGSAIGR